MLYLLSKLVWLIARPSTVLLLAGVLGVGLHGRVRGADALVVLCIGGFTAILLLPIGWCLLRPLEDRFPPAALPDRVDGIIVLGGAVDTDLTAARGLPALNQAAERMTGFVALARRYPGAKLAFSGGRNALLPGGLSEADVARQLFAQLGLDRSVIYDDRSRTTDENARLLHAQIAPEAGETLAARHLGHAHAARHRPVPRRRLDRAALASRLCHRTAGG